MNQTSIDLRRQAAGQLRRARSIKGGEREQALKKAAAYKALAENEEWLAGEPEKSAPETRRKK